nr:EFR1 family ferrodoxin [uncultured Clostridium sp.]
MDRKVTIMYFSPTDTTKKIVNAIAKGMGIDCVLTVNLTDPQARNLNYSFKRDEIIIVGIPVYGGRIPGFLTPVFEKIKGEGTQAVFVAVYGNRAYEDALLELKNIFEENGFVGIAAGAFIGEHSNTKKVAAERPDAEDIESAERFGREIDEKIKEKVTGKITVQGDFPYKERKAAVPMAPDTSESCIQCGICAKYCPMEAISFSDAKKTDPSKCIRCSSCVKRCPQKAKSFHHEAFNKITDWLIENCSQVRCEPEWFI